MAEHAHPAGVPTPQTPLVSSAASTARFELPAETFALADLFERVPDAQVEIEPAIANPDDHALLVVESERDESAVDAALQADPCVTAVKRFTERADGWTYRVTWEGRAHRLLQRLVAADVTLLSARGWGGQWKLRLLASERNQIAKAHEIMAELGCNPECRRVSTLDGETSQSGLTDEQQEALVTAFETGYYSIPRDVTSKEVASELGISHQALSERLRRAHRELVETQLPTHE